MIFLSAIAVDTITSRVSGMVSNRAAEESVAKQAKIKAKEEQSKVIFLYFLFFNLQFFQSVFELLHSF